jgi:hypothetical protein
MMLSNGIEVKFAFLGGAVWLQGSNVEQRDTSAGSSSCVMREGLVPAYLDHGGFYNFHFGNFIFILSA